MLLSNETEQKECDKASISMIRSVIENSEYLEHPFVLAPNYPVPSVIIYHLARLLREVKIREFVNTYIDMLMAEPEVPAFIINELNTNPQAFLTEVLSKPIRPNPMGFFAQIEGEVMAGRIRRVSPLDLMLNMVSMCVFPFVARPLVQGIFAIPESGYMEMMNNRKTEIFNFIWNSIRIDVT